MAQVTKEKKEAKKAAPSPMPKKAATTKKPAGPVIYMGPNLRNLITHGQVFIDGIPPIPGDLVEVATPLFLPVDDLPKAKMELSSTTSPLSKAYAKAKAALEEGGIK
jgi:hypothetical protein